MAIMAYQALVFCPDPKVTQVLTTVLGQLDFHAESCFGPFDAVKKLTERHFDALLVDCDDEQNAALLFKSARNSEVNSTSLAVAVVENQAAISKAFRIGANLILTKPINVEQAKGTLRVARGLLKKSDLSKSLAAAKTSPATAEALPEPGPSKAPPFTEEAASSTNLESNLAVPPPAPSPVAFQSPVLQLEPEEETAPPLGPAEAALLESMPEMVPEQPSTGLAGKHAAWKSVFTPEGESAASILESAPALQPEAHADKATAVGKNASVGAGAAVAPARVKEATPFELPPVDQEGSVPLAAEPDSKPAKAKKRKSSSKAKAGGVEKFSWQEAAREQGESEEQHSGKNLLVAAVLVLTLAAAGYFAWPRLGPVIMNLTFVQKYIAPHLAQEPEAPPVAPAASPTSSTPAQPNGSSPAASAPLTDGSQPENNGSVPSSAAAVPASGMKPDAGTPVAEVQSVPSAAPHEIITVKSGSVSTAKPGSGRVLPPPALSPSSGGDQTIAGLVSTAPAIPKPMQGLHIPESTMEGQLIKKVQPIYPTLAAQMRVEGTVQLEARIGKDGSVASLKLVRGESMLAKAATDAVRQWKYRPYVLGGQPIEVQTEITVTFKLP